MLPIMLMTAALSLGPKPDEAIDRHQLIQLIEAAQRANCQDVCFD